MKITQKTFLKTAKNPFVFLILCALYSPIVANAQTSFDTSNFDHGEQVPPDFGKENTVLLVVQMDDKKYDKQLAANFKQYYTGKYIIVDADGLLSTSYSDRNVYRYVFRIQGAVKMFGKLFAPAGITFAITDLVAEKVYNTNQTASDKKYSQLMILYIKALEKKRMGL